jgi:hypothetical protein
MFLAHLSALLDPEVQQAPWFQSVPPDPSGQGLRLARMDQGRRWGPSDPEGPGHSRFRTVRSAQAARSDLDSQWVQGGQAGRPAPLGRERRSALVRR